MERPDDFLYTLPHWKEQCQRTSWGEEEEREEEREEESEEAQEEDVWEAWEGVEGWEEDEVGAGWRKGVSLRDDRQDVGDEDCDETEADKGGTEEQKGVSPSGWVREEKEGEDR